MKLEDVRLGDLVRLNGYKDDVWVVLNFARGHSEMNNIPGYLVHIMNLSDMNRMIFFSDASDLTLIEKGAITINMVNSYPEINVANVMEEQPNKKESEQAVVTDKAIRKWLDKEIYKNVQPFSRESLFNVFLQKYIRPDALTCAVNNLFDSVKRCVNLGVHPSWIRGVASMTKVEEKKHV